MPELPRLTAEDGEKMLLKAGFENIRSKGSHRIFKKGKDKFVLPFHRGKILHPKIIKSLIELIDDSNR